MHVPDRDLVATLSAQTGDTPLVAAVYARFETALSASRWLGPLGNYFVARPAARAAAQRVEERTEVPLDAAVVLGLTASELHVWAADPMRSHVDDHLGAVPLERIADVSAEVAKSWWPLTLTLTDGESVEVSARGDVRSFVSAFEQRAGRPAA